MGTFAIAYTIAIGAAFLPAEPTWPKLVVAALLILIYARYVKRHFEADPDVDAVDLAPLRFRGLDARPARRPRRPAPPDRLNPGGRGTRLIVIGAFLSSGPSSTSRRSLGVGEILLALVVAPIATELPEKFNSIIWVRQGKDTLAMGNITGAMVFQASIPTVVALVLAGERWHVAGRHVDGLPVRGHRLRVERGDLHPDVRPARPTAGRGLVGGPVTSPTCDRRPRDRRGPPFG